MRLSLFLLALLMSGCSGRQSCGEARTHSKLNQDKSFTPLGTEVPVQLPAAQRKALLAQVPQAHLRNGNLTDTGCWFELKGGPKLRLHDPASGWDVEFEKKDGSWQFARVLNPILI